jgi:hypothetical protein
MSPTRVRPLYPIYTGCHGRLRKTNPIKIKQNFSYPCSIFFYPCSTSFYPKFCPNSNLLFFLCPGADWRHSSWHANTITHQGAPTLMGSLKSRSSLDFRNNLRKLSIPVWLAGWFGGQPVSIMTCARAGVWVYDRILRQQNCWLVHGITTRKTVY